MDSPETQGSGSSARPRRPRPSTTRTSASSTRSGRDEERPYIAMEYVEGETLRDKIRNGPLEPGEAVGPHRPGRGRAGGGPRQGHRPPGRQERQHHGHGQGPGQGHGLRSGQAPGRLVADEEPDDRRDGGLHVAGAGPGRGARPAHGHLVAGRRALRDARGQAAVPGRPRPDADLFDPPHRSRSRSPRSVRTLPPGWSTSSSRPWPRS